MKDRGILSVMRSLTFTFLLFYFFAPSDAPGARPIRQYNDLVAGIGDPSHRDGPFWEASFHHPTGLAVSADGSRLYVADTSNHRIREILLRENNHVRTLAGADEGRSLDGDLRTARFNFPTQMIRLMDGRLLVFDQGSGKLRLLDLENGSVRTFSPKDHSGEFPGLRGLAQDPGTGEVLLTLPNEGLLLSLSLTGNTVEFFLKDHPQVPRPSGVAFHGNKAFVSDEKSGIVFRARSLDRRTTPFRVDLESAGKAEGCLTLSGDPEGLFSLQEGEEPITRPLAPDPAFRLMSLWGPFIDPASPNGRELLSFRPGKPPALVSDPTESRRYFLTIPHRHIVISIRDYDFWKLKDSQAPSPNGLIDFDYPKEKPKDTYRILLLGDSRIRWTEHQELVEGFHRWPWGGFNRMEMLPKQLEILMNTRAALEEESLSYQVLGLSELRHEPLFLWPLVQAPPAVASHDVDLVVMTLFPDNLSYRVWFDHPIQPNGLPSPKADPEYHLKPVLEKMKGPKPALDFFRKGLKAGLVREDPLHVPDIHALKEHPELLEGLEYMIGMPIGRLRAKIQSLKTSAGTPVKFILCFSPLGGLTPGYETQIYRDFWRKVCRKEKIHFVDLSEPYLALRQTYFPFSEAIAFRHFDKNGHVFLSRILEHALRKEGLLPKK